jgi:hypothetical protein
MAIEYLKLRLHHNMETRNRCRMWWKQRFCFPIPWQVNDDGCPTTVMPKHRDKNCQAQSSSDARTLLAKRSRWSRWRQFKVDFCLIGTSTW